MKTVVGFGEVMIRLSPRGHNAFGDSNAVQIHAGGAEANVLAKVGALSDAIRTDFVTALKDDLGGRAIRADLQQFGVGLDHVRWTDQHRNGVYFLEQGLGPITARVDYDRQDSAIANLKADPELFTPLDHADAYFVCGITPALSNAGQQNTRLSLERAKKNNVGVFFDVNYRNKLWSTARARETLETYIKDELITCLITTETDARAVFGIDEGVDDDSPMDALIERSKKTLQAFRARYGNGCQMYLLTIRKRITNDTGQWTSAVLMPDGKYLVGDVFDYTILDRPGAGDSCSAGIIGGYLGITPTGDMDDSRSLADRMQTGLNLGNRMSVTAQKTIGDFGPLWSAKMFFARVSEAREISR